MDILKYQDQKKAGFVDVKRYGAEFAITARRFDPATGEEVAPEVGVMNRASIVAQRDAAQAQVDGLNALLADMDALTKK